MKKVGQGPRHKREGQGKLAERMKEIRVEIPSGKDFLFEGEQIARINDQIGGMMVLWRTKGGRYVMERTAGNDKEVEIYTSAKGAASLILDTYRSAGKKLIKAAQSKDKDFEGLTEQRIK
jgi:hypothetical protein